MSFRAAIGAVIGDFCDKRRSRRKVFTALESAVRDISPLGRAVALISALAAAAFAQPADAAKYKAIVIDADSGEVLFQRNADGRHYPASLTKMMTLYLTFEALDSGALSMDKDLKVSKRASGQAPSRLGLRAGQTIRVEDAILAVVTKSANDAATVLAENLADSEIKFAIKMTETARRLGMRKTVFRNASGLPNRRQVSTPRDMATLARALIADFPQFYHYFSAREFAWGNRIYKNHNNLLEHYDGVDGLKTGYIRASGFNIATSAQRDGKRVIGVVMGGKTSSWRDERMAYLLDVAFHRSDTLELVSRKDDDETPTRSGADDLVTTAEADSGTTDPDERNERVVNAPVAPKPPSVPPAKSGDWGIQVGAFSAFGVAYERAEEAAKSVPRLLARARKVIDKALGDSRQIYRSRLFGISEMAAREACKALIRKKFECFAVPPNDDALEVASR
jgi:D-alanyl-D-alanine carboxypeptidase